MSDSECFELPKCASTSGLDSSERAFEAMEVDEENQEDTDDNEDKEFEKLLWSIDDDTLFQPLGLTNHGTDAGKTVFVTWNEDYLINFVFKRAKRTNKISLTKVRIPMPFGEIINDMFIIEMNALLLMRSGRVYYFSSVKSMHAIDWLNDTGGGVRCMSAAPTAGFSCIRYVAAQTALFLEMYRDVPDIGRSVPVLLQRCDITFDDKNLFNCSWDDERYTLVSRKVTAKNKTFLQYLLMGEMELKEDQWIHIFTVSSVVFALVVAGVECSAVDDGENAPDCDYSIQQLCAYATNVSSIQLDCEENRCLIFLQCGTIDIWYYSHFTCGLRRMQHYTGAQYSHHVYVPATRCFYFTDEEQVAQLHFSYDAEMDSCQVQETYKAIPGMVACTWVETQHQLICLSCNNIFYKINFEPTHNAKHSFANSTGSAAAVSTEYENLQVLYELTPARLSRLLAKVEKVNELVNLPARMHAAVENECVKQQLLGVLSDRHLYRYLAKARLAYSIQLPTAAQEGVIMLYANNFYQLHHDSYAALIYLQIDKNDLLHSGDSLWHLHIDVDCSDSYMLHIPSGLLNQQLCIALPLMRTAGKLLAEIKVQLYTLVCLEADFVAINLPIDLEVNSSTFAELFTRFKRCVTICNDYDIPKLIKSFFKHSKNKVVQARASEEVNLNMDNDQKSSTTLDVEMLSHTLRLPSTCTFSAIAACFQVPITAQQSFDLYFMSAAIKIAHIVEEKHIKMESVDAMALYYLKIQLLINMPELLVNGGDENGAEERQQMLIQLQCDLTSCGAALLQVPTFDENNADEESDTIPRVMQMQQLKRIYTKMRKDFHRLYS
ncbi:uncharacterized protein LOC128864245 [Anastrepha ludens]|uniref:uncharacterized protein LOC128864245 n=1 Tax=Anastrepha ludens TaxID=28586 RepID=UPI0023B0C0C1|nr:uncharacterized protein LOC128864245 [Anastrepha ludens]